MNVVKLVGTSWLVHDGKRGIIVDAARKGQTEVIKKRLEPLKLTIPLLFLTHTHYDHTGCAQALHQHTKAKVFVGTEEADCLRKGHTPIPKGTHAISRMISSAGHMFMSKQTEYYEAITEDIVPVNLMRDLDDFGFDAQAVSLGGHTIGSIGLQIGDYFFVGDTVFGVGGVLYPPFADDPDGIRTAWKKILDSGAKYICPGHSGIIKRQLLAQQYQARYVN